MRKYILFPSLALLLCATSFAQEATLYDSKNDFSENQNMVTDTVKNKKGQIKKWILLLINSIQPNNNYKKNRPLTF